MDLGRKDGFFGGFFSGRLGGIRDHGRGQPIWRGRAVTTAVRTDFFPFLCPLLPKSLKDIGQETRVEGDIKIDKVL